MKSFKMFCDIVQKLILIIIAAFAAVMIIVTTVEVVRRYIFSESYQWAEELSRYLMIGIAFLGAAIGYRNRGLIPLDLITGRLAPRTQLILETVLEAVTFVVLIVLLYLSVKSVMSPVVFRQRSVGLPISMGIPFAAMPIGFGCMILFAIEHFLEFPQRLKEAN